MLHDLHEVTAHVEPNGQSRHCYALCRLTTADSQNLHVSARANLRFLLACCYPAQ